MTNNQNLIKWMTEIRQDLTFEKKSQLLWDFWQLRSKYKTDDLSQAIDSEIKQLNQQMNTAITAKEQQIENLRKTKDKIIKNLELQKTQAEQEIISKNDRITQLDAVVKGSALIFQNQQQIIDDLIAKLEDEKEKNKDNAEYQKHVVSDIRRLANERKELTKGIEDLKNLNEENKRIRDTEIQDLREKLTNLAQIIEQIQRVNEQVYTILGQVSQQTGLLLRAQQVVAILNKPKREFGTQTNITIPPTDQWETDLEKYKQDIQNEQNKVSALQTKLANLRQEIKGLQDQTKLNPAEQELSKYVKQQTWKNVNFQTLKITLTNLERDFSHKLRPNYQEIRTKLLELVNSLISGKETQEQLENRNKELEEKLKEGDLNEIEKELLEIAETPIGTDRSFFGDSKKMIEPKELKKMLQGDKWNQLRADYQAIKKRLIDLADKELEVKGNQQTIKDLTQKKDDLQIQLDLATKTKEQLAQELAKEKWWLDKIVNIFPTSSTHLREMVKEVKAEREREKRSGETPEKREIEESQLTEMMIRNWQSFYNWLEKNIVDREAGGPGKGNIKEEKRGEYPIITSISWTTIAYLMIMLEKTLNIPLKEYANTSWKENYTKKIKKLEEYEENKNFLQLTSFRLGDSRANDELEKLFSEWKKDTPLVE